MKKIAVTVVILTALTAPVLVSAQSETKASTEKIEQKTTSRAVNSKEATSQKVQIQKVVSEAGKTIAGGKAQSKLVGVNGASFKVYDITQLMIDTLDPFIKLEKEKAELKDKLTSSTEKETASNQEKLDNISKDPITQNDFLDKLTQEAKKQDLSKLKVFAQGNTKNADSKDGIFEFTVPVEKATYRAYYIINDKVDDDKATISEPFVLITPVIESETGLPMDTVYVYPKSQLIEKPLELTREFPNTGIKKDWLSDLINLFRR